MTTLKFRAPPMYYNKKDLDTITPTHIAIYYRSAKKICRKCYGRLPLDSNKCKNPKCHNVWLPRPRSSAAGSG